MRQTAARMRTPSRPSARSRSISCSLTLRALVSHTNTPARPSCSVHYAPHSRCSLARKHPRCSRGRATHEPGARHVELEAKHPVTCLTPRQTNWLIVHSTLTRPPLSISPSSAFGFAYPSQKLSRTTGIGNGLNKIHPRDARELPLSVATVGLLQEQPFPSNEFYFDGHL